MVHNKSWKLEDIHCAVDKSQEVSSAVVASNIVIIGEYQVITEVNKYLVNERKARDL